MNIDLSVGNFKLFEGDVVRNRRLGDGEMPMIFGFENGAQVSKLDMIYVNNT
jgi:hypothetical protein